MKTYDDLLKVRPTGGRDEVNDERKKATAVMAPRCQRVGKKDKGKVLDEFISLTGYRRSYASFVLSSHGMRTRLGRHRILVADVRTRGHGGGRHTIHGHNVLKVLITIWYLIDRICGMRLTP